MGEQVYKKLVRDKIPDKIKANGENPVTRVLSDGEYKKKLEKKLLEEYNEVLKAENSEERIEELADMLEVIISLSKLENKTLNDIMEVANIKREKRGGFDNKIFLEKVLN